MDDKVDRRLERLLDRIGADQPLLRFRPRGGAVGEFILADNDEYSDLYWFADVGASTQSPQT